MSNPIPPAPDGGKEGTTTVETGDGLIEIMREAAEADDSTPVTVEAFPDEIRAVLARIVSPSSVPAPTQREEWVVQVGHAGRGGEGGEWRDYFVELGGEALGREARDDFERTHPSGHFRLVHRTITESVIEEPS